MGDEVLSAGRIERRMRSVRRSGLGQRVIDAKLLPLFSFLVRVEWHGTGIGSCRCSKRPGIRHDSPDFTGWNMDRLHGYRLGAVEIAVEGGIPGRSGCSAK